MKGEKGGNRSASVKVKSELKEGVVWVLWMIEGEVVALIIFYRTHRALDMNL